MRTKQGIGRSSVAFIPLWILKKEKDYIRKHTPLTEEYFGHYRGVSSAFDLVVDVPRRIPAAIHQTQALDLLRIRKNDPTSINA